MGDIVVVESATQVEEGIAGRDVRQERIAQALALGGTSNKNNRYFFIWKSYFKDM